MQFVQLNENPSNVLIYILLHRIVQPLNAFIPNTNKYANEEKKMPKIDEKKNGAVSN